MTIVATRMLSRQPEYIPTGPLSPRASHGRRKADAESDADGVHLPAHSLTVTALSAIDHHQTLTVLRSAGGCDMS